VARPIGAGAEGTGRLGSPSGPDARATSRACVARLGGKSRGRPPNPPIANPPSPIPGGGGSQCISLGRNGLSTFFRQSPLYMGGHCDSPGAGAAKIGPENAQISSPGVAQVLVPGRGALEAFSVPRPSPPKRAPQSRPAERAECPPGLPGRGALETIPVPRSFRPVGRRSRGLRNALHVCRHPPTVLFDNRIGSGCTNEPFHGPPVVPTRRSHATRAAGRGKSTLASDFAPPSVKQITGGAIGAPELFPGHPRRRTTPRTRARRDRSLFDT